MKIVIDIPDNIYDAIKSAQTIVSGQRNGKTLLQILVSSVENGTPLDMAIRALKGEQTDGSLVKENTDLVKADAENADKKGILEETVSQRLVKEDLISRKDLLKELEKWDWQELYLPIHFKELVDELPSAENTAEE